ncbi:hypothetical protein [Vulcanisaeta distributa]|uniref:hypothetical protein n=1 Tax=Vulcanisaeta distributa TaxID=164451 RepID=UPI001FB46340|nr:hypothetical protein [Vulcanisaeta distributa]
MRIKGSRRLKCGEEVSDPRVVEETMKLINEFMNRVEKHRNVLLNESTTPFDNAINALRNWLMPMEEKIKDVSDEGIANLSIAMINAGRKMLRLAERAREKWLRRYKPELVELIEKLRGGGEAAIIIRGGDPFNEDRSFMAHLYTKHLVVKVERVVRSGDVTVTISLTELGGVDVVTPKLFGDGVLRPMQYGLMLTDGGQFIRRAIQK